MQPAFSKERSTSIDVCTAPAAAPRPTVFVVEPNPSIREEVAERIEQAGWDPVVSNTAEQFMARPRAIVASCLLVEESLPGMSGLELQGLVASRREMPVIFMGKDGDIRTTVKAMKAGAFDFLTKPLGEEALLSSIGAAIEHSIGSLGTAARIQELHQSYHELSRREREVLRLVVTGRLNKQVGFDLGISEITVKAHRGSVMRKMHAGSFAELVGMVADLPSDIDTRCVWRQAPRGLRHGWAV